jgi:hypothetical protein
MSLKIYFDKIHHFSCVLFCFVLFCFVLCSDRFQKLMKKSFNTLKELMGKLSYICGNNVKLTPQFIIYNEFSVNSSVVVVVVLVRSWRDLIS